MNFTPEAIEQGRKRLEEILNREIPLTDKYRRKIINDYYQNDLHFKKEYSPEMDVSWEKNEKELKRQGRLVCVRLIAPEIVGRGDHQITIDIGEGLVAKMRYEIFLSNNERTVSVARKPLGMMNETRQELVDHGIDVPPMQFLNLRWRYNKVALAYKVEHSSWGDSERRLEEFRKTKKIKFRRIPQKYSPKVCITTDLRENGRYFVVDYDPEIAQQLVNGSALVDEFNTKAGFLFDCYNQYIRDLEHLEDGKLYLQYDPHKQNPHARQAPQKAIKGMFFLQVPIDATQPGKLVVGDIDQVYVFR